MPAATSVPSYLSKEAITAAQTKSSSSIKMLPDVMTLISTDRLFPTTDASGMPSAFTSCNMREIAKEALRLTRETLGSSRHVSMGSSSTPESPSSKSPSQQVVVVCNHPPTATSGVRLNKFVRRLHDMLQSEKDSGIVEWRRGLLVLHSTDAFAKQILPKYFNTRNFKTFRRQLNYYGFVHVRSFSTTGTATTALWVNRELAQSGSDDISSVLLLRRVEPCDTAKTTEGRRERKELAIHTVEEDIGVSAKTLQMEQIRSMAERGIDCAALSFDNVPPVPREIHFPSGGGGQHERRRSLSSVDSIMANFHGVNGGQVMQVATLSSHMPDATEVSSASSSDEESAANLLLTLAKFGTQSY